MKRLLWIVLVVLILVLIGLLFMRALGGNSQPETVGETQIDGNAPADTAPAVPDTAAAPESEAPAETVPYEEEEETVPEERGEDYSPIIDEYTVDLQDDEVFEIG